MSRHIIGSLVAALIVLPTAAQAQETLTACYVPKSGSVYRIKTPDTPAACKSNHVQFSWTHGASTFTRHESAANAKLISPNAFAQLTAECDAGEVVVSGGWTTYPNGPVSVSASRPNTGLDQQPLQEWFVDVRNTGSDDIYAWAYVICARSGG